MLNYLGGIVQLELGNRNKYKINEINIFPNPIKKGGSFKLLGSIENLLLLKIYDLNGKVVFETNRSSVDKIQIEPGLYIVEILIKDKKLVKKIVVN